MALISDFPGRVASLLLRLVLALAAAVLAASLLLAGLVVVVFMLVRALLTGRKPAPVRVWQRYRAASKASGARWKPQEPSGSPPRRPGVRTAAADDVVDVPSRDITPH